MELLMMETEDEQNFILNLINERFQNYFEEFTHIGGTREGSATDWYWASTGRSIEYKIKWLPGTPDNFPNNMGIEYCMSIANMKGSNSAFLNDSPCYTEFSVWRVICERSSNYSN